MAGYAIGVDTPMVGMPAYNDATEPAMGETRASRPKGSTKSPVLLTSEHWVVTAQVER